MMTEEERYNNAYKNYSNNRGKREKLSFDDWKEKFFPEELSIYEVEIEFHSGNCKTERVNAISEQDAIRTAKMPYSGTVWRLTDKDFRIVSKSKFVMNF